MMTFSPIERGSLLSHSAPNAIAKAHQATLTQIALTWLLRQEGVIAILKAGRPSHVEENVGALDIDLSKGDLAALDQAFPPPFGPMPLEIL